MLPKKTFSKKIRFISNKTPYRSKLYWSYQNGPESSGYNSHTDKYSVPILFWQVCIRKITDLINVIGISQR